MDITVIVPLFNEEESLPELESWISKVMKANNLSYEILFIDDGSTDKSWEVVDGLCSKNPINKGVKFRRNYGKSAALNVAFERAEGDVVITMDADLQDSPDEIPELYRMVKEEGYDLVSGWKEKRHDPIGKTLPSKIFNGTVRRVSGIKLNDFNCGLKAYRKQVVKSIEVYGDMHRYIPVIAKNAGFSKIGEKVVQHQARKYGVSKYGFMRVFNGFLDLATVTFLGKFGKQPMHFLGTIGTILSMIGFVILAGFTIGKFAWDQSINDRPLFYLGILLMIIGTQLFVAGFVAELVARSSESRNHYLIEVEKGISQTK
jgi:glycosyltransferase involved in cell wall biosynthesis